MSIADVLALSFLFLIMHPTIIPRMYYIQPSVFVKMTGPCFLLFLHILISKNCKEFTKNCV